MRVSENDVQKDDFAWILLGFNKSIDEFLDDCVLDTKRHYGNCVYLSLWYSSNLKLSEEFHSELLKLLGEKIHKTIGKRLRKKTVNKILWRNFHILASDTIDFKLTEKPKCFSATRIFNLRKIVTAAMKMSGSFDAVDRAIEGNGPRRLSSVFNKFVALEIHKHIHQHKFSSRPAVTVCFEHLLREMFGAEN